MRRSGAEAVIHLLPKFCEPHMLYYPELRKGLDAAGIPQLLLETEHEGLPAESFRTRVEALVERVRRKRPVPLLGMAKHYLLCPTNHGAKTLDYLTLRDCREYDVDGIVFHSTRTCRAFTGPQRRSTPPWRRPAYQPTAWTARWLPQITGAYGAALLAMESAGQAPAGPAPGPGDADTSVPLFPGPSGPDRSCTDCDGTVASTGAATLVKLGPTYVSEHLSVEAVPGQRLLKCGMA